MESVLAAVVLFGVVAILATVIAPMVSAPGVHAPGFNCARATQHAEQLICGNPTLAALDVRLNAVYKQALAATSQKESLRAGQAAWVEQRRNQCQSVACLMQAYTDRNSIRSWEDFQAHACQTRGQFKQC